MDWPAVLARLLEGDRLAFAELNRLVTRLLVAQKVYDLREEWDDLRQEVVLAVVKAARSSRPPEPDALVAFVRSITRNKVADRLGERYRRHEAQVTSLEDVQDAILDPATPGPEDAARAAVLWGAVAELPPEEQAAVRGVYGTGKTYEAVATEIGLPLGTMKRRLRDALATLRRRFDETGPRSDPESPRRETSLKGRAAT